MPLFEGKTPAERNKLIAALALGVLALLLLGRTFFGGATKPTTRPPNSNAARRTTTDVTQTTVTEADPTLEMPRPLDVSFVPVSAPDAGRNIFAFYQPPVRTQAPVTVVVATPTPTPTPPPPQQLASVSPSRVFARTEQFTMTVGGDKFTPQTRVYVDGQELPTTFVGPQQLTVVVPATLISAPGTRQIVTRTPDGQLYSNSTAFSVDAPPTPQFTYVGLLGKKRYNGDVAMLKLPNNDVVSAQRGDVLGGRFRLVSISERAVDFVDTQLNIKHTLPYSEQRAGAGPPSQPRPFTPAQPRADDDDSTDEP